jgi:hypothetical protein
MDDAQRELDRALAQGQPVALARIVEGPAAGSWLLVWPAGHTKGDLGQARLNQRAALYAEALFDKGPRPSRKSFDVDGRRVTVAFEFHRP